MKKLFFTAITICSYLISAAQTDKDWKKTVIERPGDHFMINLTSDHWAGAPDTLNNKIQGQSRGLGFAVMIDKPFKTDPHWSVAFGLGINGSNIFLKNTIVDLSSTGSLLPIHSVDSTDHFKKYKLVNVFAEIPIELRYAFHPENKNCWKAALGLKVGTMIDAHTKGKNLVNSAGSTINAYTLKESKKSFFNTTRIAATARVGYGNFSLVGTYSLTALIKDGVGPTVRPYQIGLCISGL